MISNFQKPIDSGFHAKSNSNDIVQNIDLVGKKAIITGGYSGIGLETTKSLVGAGAEVFIPAPAKGNQLMKVHTQEYINKIKDGNLSMKEEKVLGLPWSETLSKRSYLAVNGTYLTSDLALSHGIACHLAGGTHHAYSNYGSGFCVFNDLAYAAKNMISEGKCKKVLIIDCDVHQGDGTADICKNDKKIFFLLIGHGVQYKKVEKFISRNRFLFVVCFTCYKTYRIS